MSSAPALAESKKWPEVTHVIFDVDGLIIDTESIYTEALNELCREYGHEFTWEIKSQQMGKKEADAAKILLDTLQIPMSVEEYSIRIRAKIEEKCSYVTLLPGAERLIRHLHAHNIPIALATGSDKWNFERKSSAHKELFSLFLHCVTASDDPEVKHGKPAPDVFLVAAKRFKNPPEPERVLVFEDAPNGAESGVAAGMQVVWVPDPRADRSSLEGKVVEILESLEQFEPQRYGLPPFPKD